LFLQKVSQYLISFFQFIEKRTLFFFFSYKFINDFLAIRRNKDLYYNKKIEAEEEFAVKIGLEPRESESEEEDLTDLWEIAPVINSVDGKTPPIPLDMAHDGILIYHTCHHDICGAKFECRYWGD
jgi:hypothetical protein